MLDVWVTLCTRVMVDTNTNLLSLIDLVDKLDVSVAPEGARVPLPTQLAVVARWRRDDSEGPVVIRQRIVFRRSDGPALVTFEPQDISLERNHLGVIITHVPMIVLEGYGQYRFDVERLVGEQWGGVAWTGLFIEQASLGRPAP